MSRPVYVLTGDELLVDEALDRVRREEGTDDLSETSFDPSADPMEILTALGTASLLGDKRLVVVHDAGDLPTEAARLLESYLEAPAPSSVLVLTATARTKLDAAAKKKGASVALEAPRGRRLAAWVRERGRAFGLKLDDRAAWALIDVAGTGLRGLHLALQQLGESPPVRDNQGRVGATDVRTAFPRLADERIYVLTDAVGDRRLPVAMGTLRRLLDQGDEPLVLFGALTALVRRLLRARAVGEGGARAVGDALGLPGWKAERLYRQARSFKEEELVSALSLLAATDVELKGGDLPPEAALERAVVGIVAGSSPG